VPIVGGVTGTAGNLLSVAPALFVLKYDRSQELEADLRGIYFSDTMGYDPREGLKTFELFQGMAEESGDADQLSILSTHPANDRRIECMEEAIVKDSPEVTAKLAGSFRSSGGRFAAIIEDLQARAPAYAAHDRARRILATDPDQSGESVGVVVDRATAELRSAIELLPDEPLFHVDLPEALRWLRGGEKRCPVLPGAARDAVPARPRRGGRRQRRRRAGPLREGYRARTLGFADSRRRSRTTA
jgi:predicted Zn-dependent protease